jgi:hypothetical protein
MRAQDAAAHRMDNTRDTLADNLQAFVADHNANSTEER